MENEKAPFSELVIRRVEVRTHFGDPTQKYTRDRVRTWTDFAAGTKRDYEQSATTHQQRATLRSRVSSSQYSLSSCATADAFSYAAEAEDDPMEAPVSW